MGSTIRFACEDGHTKNFVFNPFGPGFGSTRSSNQDNFDCSVCKDCPPPPKGLAALFANGTCKQRCDLCGFCRLAPGIGQCKFCVKAPGDPVGSKGCTRKCEIGEPLCKGPCKTQC